MAEASFVVLQCGGPVGGVLLDVLAARRRPIRIVARDQGEPPPADPAAVRALIVVGGADDRDVGLLRACHEVGVPVLALGGGARAVESVLGMPSSAAPDHESVEFLEVWRRPEAEDDPVFAGVPDGATWFASPAPPPGEPVAAVPLAVDGHGRVVALRAGASTYALWLRPDLEPSDHPYALASGAGEHMAPFLRAPAAGLLGRFVDRVVGRTEAEAPWGRRGPAPTSAPDLYYHSG